MRYEAALNASAGFAEGSVGAGAGATVGKLAGIGRAMKSGVGSASIVFPSGLKVAALVVVNALGDVVDPVSGKVLAGTRTEDGKSLVDVRLLIRAAEPLGSLSGSSRSNTTLGLVVTNAPLTKSQASLVARLAHDGYARAIYPVHTSYDGDIVFTAATGSYGGKFDLVTLGAAAQEVVSMAIVRAVTRASGLEGLPSAKDLGSSR